jgi:hypothetical protein
MKKLLLFSLIIGFALSTTAQHMMISKKNLKRVQDGMEITIEKPIPMELPELNQKGVNEDVTPIVVGKAAHQRGVRREEAHVISYHPEMDVITVTSVLDPATYEGVDDVGIIGMWYSTDHGQTWSDPVILNNNISEGPNYYMSGAPYNPDGNTTVDNMFGVHQGTIYPTAGDWRFKAFGSSTFAGDNQTNYLFEETGMDGYFNIFGLNQYGDDMRCLHLKTTGPWAAFTDLDFQPITGAFNGESFDWDFSNIVNTGLYIESNGEATWVGKWQGYDAATEIAWSNDGEIGYMWVIGVSDEDISNFQPVVFRTEDAGDSWDYIFLDFLDNDIQDILEPYLFENWAGYMLPLVRESAGVVDAHGNLQILISSASTSSDCVNYPDSIGWGWTNDIGHLFNVSVDENGIADLIWVDSLNTENPIAATEGNYCGTEGWQHRISAAKSQDEMQVFFTWIETRDEGAEFNLNPDLFGWSRSFCDNPLTMDSPVCFSEGAGDLEEHFYFNCGAEVAYSNDDGSYTVPYLQGVNPIEFLTNTSTSGDPITLSYVTGIEFPNLCAVGIGELASLKNVSVTQNMPNPFTGLTVIEVSTGTAAAVTVEVSNIMGQSVYTVDAGIINGTQKIQLSAENLESGVYFYTVHVGSESITNKMIVE